ncbi:MAG: DUF350 domain-containing protein [Arcobacter sp.]|nr:DUF350 domain-containing protein [Arcobacter sp.]
MEILILFIQSIVYAMCVFMFIYFAKVIADYRVASIFNVDYQILVSENIAVSLRRAGLYLGVAIGMYAAIEGNSSNFIEGLISEIIYGILILIFLFIAMFINDKIILKGINNDEEIKNNNISVGLFEMGSYIATGIIAYGSFIGSGPWYSSIIFFALGQLVLIAMVWIYRYLTKYDSIKEIKEGNIPAGLMIGGIMIAYGLILKASIIGPFTNWTNDLSSFALSALSGILLLLVFANKAIDKLFLPGSNIHKEIAEDKDLPPIIVVVAIKISIAIIISAVIL